MMLTVLYCTAHCSVLYSRELIELLKTKFTLKIQSLVKKSCKNQAYYSE